MDCNIQAYIQPGVLKKVFESISIDLHRFGDVYKIGRSEEPDKATKRIYSEHDTAEEAFDTIVDILISLNKN